MTKLYLHSCKISDEEAQLLATVLHALKRLERLWLSNNDIHDMAIALADALLGLPQLRVVNLEGNPISASVREALDKKTGHIWRQQWGGRGNVFHYQC